MRKHRSIDPAKAYTTQQAADFLGVSRPHLVKLLNQQSLPHHKTGTHRRVRGSDILDFLDGGGETPKSTVFGTIEQAIAEISEGRLIIVVDDDDRENEGDLIMAAVKATPERIAFMIRHTSGILCAPISADHARDLGLSLMVKNPNAPLKTAFTQSIDYISGLTTGIAASERCNTFLALADTHKDASDFVQPGHVFPLIAAAGGVLTRSGHTEAARDLVELAGMPPVGVLAELVNDDGSVQRLPDLIRFARVHGLKIYSIADLIAYRRSRERLVLETARRLIATGIGPAELVIFQSRLDQVEHLALLFGDLRTANPPLVRIHRENKTSDVFTRHAAGSNAPLTQAMARIQKEGRGIIIYLSANETMTKPSSSNLADETVELTRNRTWREIGIGAQILRELGVRHIRLLTTQTHDYVGLGGFDLHIDSVELLSRGPT